MLPMSKSGGTAFWSSPEYFDTMERLIKAADIDFRICYAIFSREAADRILPATMDNGVAVQINIPLRKRAYLPAWWGKRCPILPPRSARRAGRNSFSMHYFTSGGDLR
jgi:hypothetical protein